MRICRMMDRSQRGSAKQTRTPSANQLAPDPQGAPRTGASAGIVLVAHAQAGCDRRRLRPRAAPLGARAGRRRRARRGRRHGVGGLSVRHDLVAVRDHDDRGQRQPPALRRPDPSPRCPIAHRRQRVRDRSRRPRPRAPRQPVDRARRRSPRPAAHDRRSTSASTCPPRSSSSAGSTSSTTHGHPFKRAELGADDGAGLPIITGLDRTTYVANPEAHRRRRSAARSARSPRGAKAASGPSIGEVHLDPHGALTLVTYEHAISIQLGTLDDALPARMHTFDADVGRAHRPPSARAPAPSTSTRVPTKSPSPSQKD